MYLKLMILAHLHMYHHTHFKARLLDFGKPRKPEGMMWYLEESTSNVLVTHQLMCSSQNIQLVTMPYNRCSTQ